MKRDKQSIDEYFNRFLQDSHFHHGDVCVLDITQREVQKPRIIPRSRLLSGAREEHRHHSTPWLVTKCRPSANL